MSAANGAGARSVTAHLVELGLRVLEDVSVTGFDDLDLSTATDPALPTVRQPLAEMGRFAVTLLMRIVSGHELDAMHIELATELVVRGSTGPARIASRS